MLLEKLLECVEKQVGAWACQGFAFSQSHQVQKFWKWASLFKTSAANISASSYQIPFRDNFLLWLSCDFEKYAVTQVSLNK